MVRQVQDRLAGQAPAGTTDAVLARLLPDAHRDDPELAAEQRELTEASLREGKRADGDLVLAQLPAEGGRLALTDADPWLRALNDVRLAMGVELGITEQSEPPDEVRTDQDARLSVYYWLTNLQESLVGIMLG